jgi:hypothetical protein
MKTLIRMALMASLAAFGATSAEAADVTGPGDELTRSDELTRNNDVTPAVRVVNNYGDMVRVYAEDSQGHMHKLGRVARGELVKFDIPEAIAAGPFRIKVYPSQPAWSLQIDDYGVKTNPLDLQGDTDVTVWLEPDLTRSIVEVSQG